MPSTRREIVTNAISSAEKPARRKVRPWHLLEKVVQCAIRVLRFEHQRVAEFRQVMGRHVGRHSHGDARRSVGQEVREAGGQNDRLLHLTVEIRREVYGFAVDIPQHFLGERCKAGFRIAIGRSRISVDGTEISLPVHERVTKRKVLGHADHRFVDRAVPMRVVVLENFADDTHGLLMGPARQEAFLIHGIKNAPVDGFEPVPHVG